MHQGQGSRHYVTYHLWWFRGLWVRVSIYPYVLFVREGGRVVGTALMIAIGVNEQGQRSIRGLDVGCSDNGAAWTQFTRGLVERGLHGVRLVVSDDHPGLKAAIRSVLVGSTCQTVQFTRNAVSQAAKHAQHAVSAVVCQILRRLIASACA